MNQAEIVINEKTLTVKYGNIRVTSLDGIDLTNIEQLICWGHDLTSNAVSKLPDSITNLDISSNKLTVIPESLSKLTNLNIKSNFLTKLPDTIHTWNSLKVLDCSHNNLLYISYLPPNLEHFNCSFNYKMKQFCTNGLPNKLKWLDCRYCHIYTLPPLPSSLKWLDCSSNELTTIPDLSVNMHFLDCSNNLDLDVLKMDRRYLKSLNCNGKYTTAYAIRIIQHNQKREALGLPRLKQLPFIDQQIDINLRFAQQDYEPGGKKFLECQNNIGELLLKF